MRDDELEEMARRYEGDFVRRKRTLQDFRYDEVQEKFWDVTTGLLLGARSVDGAIPKSEWPNYVDDKGNTKFIAPSKAINDVDTGLTVEGSTWWPGLPQFIEHAVITDRGAMTKLGAVCYNAYTPPQRPTPREGFSPQPWLDHVRKLFPDPLEHEHFFDFAAHAIQRPDEKVNHGVVLAGSQGIGKDTALLPIRKGVGEWNAAEIGPDAITSPYNPHVKSVLLVINEVRPQDEDYKASNFYNLLKPLLASPPEMLPMRLLYQNVVYVRNLCHVVLTTNDPLTMYIPPEDRRLFVMTSQLDDPKVSADFEEGYFDELHRYLQAGGSDAVIEWLWSRDLSEFSASAAPPMTVGKKQIIESAHQVRRTELDDLLDLFVVEVFGGNHPDVIFPLDLHQFLSTGNWFDDVQKVTKLINAKNFHFRMAEKGYEMVKNPYAPEWKRGKFRSRTAFVHKRVERINHYYAIEAALDERPLALEG